MSHASKASRPIGLFALVLGLIAFSATAAQAEPGAYWEVGGTKIEGTSTLLPEIQAKNDTKHTILLSTVGGTTVEILCAKIKFVGAKLHTLGRFTGKIHKEECHTFLNGVLVSRCTPKSPGAPLRLIETNALKGLLKLHTTGTGEKVDLLELAPETGTEFVKVALGPLCPIGNEFPITGTFFLKDCQGEGLLNKVEHLFEEGPLSALLFGGRAMTLDGSFWTFLVGAHAGMLWSVHPA